MYVSNYEMVFVRLCPFSMWYAVVGLYVDPCCKVKSYWYVDGVPLVDVLNDGKRVVVVTFDCL